MTNDAETQALLSKFIAANAASGLWLIHDKIYTAALTNVHAVESKRDDYPLMVIYRRTGGTSDVTWTISLEKFLAKARMIHTVMPDFETIMAKAPDTMDTKVVCAAMPTMDAKVDKVNCQPIWSDERGFIIQQPPLEED